jgi:spore coat polysaccharide biosynthesis predicted glycosyltransferase SpsG
MSIQSPKLLFIPVSSPEGIGEYMRSMIIADAVKQKWPDAQIRFVLNRHAPYAKDCHYQADLLDDTPTKCVQSVKDIISEFRPDIVVFDASGRRSQLAHAAKLGAKVIFLSQHKRKRSRGMKISRASVTDRHWVIQPEFVIGEISWLNKLKLKLINRPEPICIGPIFCQPDASAQFLLLEKYRLTRGDFVLFNAGSGGHLVEGTLAADIYADVAQRHFTETGQTTVMIYGANYPKDIINTPGVVSIKKLDNQTFINLLTLAQFAVLSGGDTLLQAIALKVPMLVTPVSKDQPSRIKVCKDRELVVSGQSNLESIMQSLRLMRDKKNRTHLISAMQKLPNLNGLEICINEIQDMLDDKNDR